MAIAPPNYQRDAVPTPRGWTHPHTGELLVSRPIKQQEIDEYLGVSVEEPVEMLIEAPSNGPLEDMDKKQLEALGRQHGVELDRRKSHEDLVEELEDHIENDTVDMESMTKRELEDLGREHGIELDRRKKKDDLIEELNEVIED